MISRAFAALLLLCLTASGSVLAEDNAPAVAQPQQAVKLEHKFRANQIDRYKMVIKMNANIALPGMPVAITGTNGMQMNMSIVSVLRSKVLGILPSGDAKLMYSYESMDMDMDMPGMPKIDKSQMQKAQKDVIKNMPKITMVVNKYGQVTSVEGLDKMPGMPKGMDFSSMLVGPNAMGPWSFGLPADQVGVGDAWTQDIPILNAGKMTVDYTLESLNAKLGSITAAKIRQDFSGHVEMGDLMKSMIPMMAGSMSGPAPNIIGGMDMSGWGVAYFDAARGRVARVDSDIDMIMNMSAEAPEGLAPANGPKTFNINMTMKMKLNMINLGL